MPSENCYTSRTFDHEDEMLGLVFEQVGWLTEGGCMGQVLIELSVQSTW